MPGWAASRAGVSDTRGEETSMKALRWSAGSAAVVAVLLVAGCSGGGSGTAGSGGSSSPGVSASAGPAPDAAALPKQVRSAMKNATSFHVSAVVRQGGSKVSADMSMTRSGNMSGTMSAGQTPVSVLVTEGV